VFDILRKPPTKRGPEAPHQERAGSSWVFDIIRELLGIIYDKKATRCLIF
jgi:hypothetical protein